MSDTVLLIAHSEGRDGRVAPLLERQGYRVAWCCPFKGEPLPTRFEDYAGAVVFGGPQSVNDASGTPYLQQEIDWVGRFVAAGHPFLGICLGGQMLARALGAAVQPHPGGLNEIGYYPIRPTAAADGFLDTPLQVYHWHKEGFELPAGAELLATGGEAFPNQAFRYGRNAYALQFHPEVTPPVMRRWLAEAAYCLDRPGAQPAERQIRDSDRFDAPLGAWLEGFLERWLGGTERKAARPAAL